MRDPCTHCRLLYLSSPGHRAQQGKLGVFLLGRGHRIPRHLERKPGGSGVSSTFLGSPLHRGLVTALHSGAPPSSTEALGRGWGGNAREEHEWGCRKTLPKSLTVLPQAPPKNQHLLAPSTLPPALAHSSAGHLLSIAPSRPTHCHPSCLDCLSGLDPSRDVRNSHTARGADPSPDPVSELHFCPICPKAWDSLGRPVTLTFS